MPTEIKLWHLDGERPKPIVQDKLNLESRLENWLKHDISLISNDLLVIGQQVQTDYGGFIDLLAIDPDGNLVILELKRDKTPRDIVAQSLDYASWVQNLGHEAIVDIANAFLNEAELEQAFKAKFQTGLKWIADGTKFINPSLAFVSYNDGHDSYQILVQVLKIDEGYAFQELK